MSPSVGSIPFKDYYTRKHNRILSRSVPKKNQIICRNDKQIRCRSNNSRLLNYENIGSSRLAESHQSDKSLVHSDNENSWIDRNWGKLVGGVLSICLLVAVEEIIRQNLSQSKKYGYDPLNDCVRKRSEGKIDVCIIGEKNDRNRLINDIRIKKTIVNNNLGLVGYLEYLLREHGTNYSRGGCCVGEQRAKFENWNIIEFDLDDKDIISKLRDDVAMGIFIVNNNDQISKAETITKNAMVKSVVNPFGVTDSDSGNNEGRPLPFIPVALHCGNIKNGGGGVYGKFISDEGMAYATDLNEYACGRKGCWDEALENFSYSKEEKDEYKKKINEDNS